jgi:hypothetical protein
MSTIFKLDIISDPTIESNAINIRTDILVEVFTNNFMNVFGEDVNNTTINAKDKEKLKTFLNSFSSDVGRMMDDANAIANVKTISISSYYRTGDINTDKSIVQLDMDGNEIISNDFASFSDAKENAKNILGSIEKINESELLVADSINKRAIIVDMVEQRVKWEYVSDRYIFDAHYIPHDINILVNDGTITLSDIVIGNNDYVTWVNNSSSDITIYSGDVDESSFDSSFDINQYGKYFKSEILHSGEVYTYKFEMEGKFGWFSYPVVNIGKVISSKCKISPLDYFIITEGDGNDSAFTNRVIKVNCYGDSKWTYGEGYLVKPRDARPIINNKIIIST